MECVNNDNIVLATNTHSKASSSNLYIEVQGATANIKQLKVRKSEFSRDLQDFDTKQDAEKDSR